MLATWRPSCAFFWVVLAIIIASKAGDRLLHAASGEVQEPEHCHLEMDSTSLYTGAGNFVSDTTPLSCSILALIIGIRKPWVAGNNNAADRMESPETGDCGRGHSTAKDTDVSTAMLLLPQ